MSVHRNVPLQARVFTRAAGCLTKLHNGSRLSGLALICCLLAGCAASGAGPSPIADDQNAPPKAGPVGTQTAGVEADAKAIAFTVDAISPQRRKQAIADMIESRLAYHARLVEQGAGKLTEAQFAGPYEYSYKYPFMDRVTETVYCASVNAHYPYWPFPVFYQAVIRAEKIDAGSERLKADIWDRGGPKECRGAPYGAFPELEQARAKRRKSLGLPD